MGRILLALILTVAFIGTADAAVNSIKVSGDITATAVSRDLSFGNEQREATVGLDTVENRDSEDFMLSQVRLRFDADLTENVSAVVQVINERAWGAEDEINQPGLMGVGVGAITNWGDTVAGDTMKATDTDIEGNKE